MDSEGVPDDPFARKYQLRLQRDHHAFFQFSFLAIGQKRELIQFQPYAVTDKPYTVGAGTHEMLIHPFSCGDLYCRRIEIAGDGAGGQQYNECDDGNNRADSNPMTCPSVQ